MFDGMQIGGRRGRMIATAGVLLSLIAGCSIHRDVPPVVDEDEIRRYMAETEEGRDLFRVDSLINSDPYVVPYDQGAVYRDLVDSIKRSTYWDVTPDSIAHDYGAYGMMRDAEVEVQDYFYVRTVRTSGDSLAENARLLPLHRYAYFLKRGNDAQAYLGWQMYGYRGGKATSPATLMISRQDGLTAFRGDGLNYQYFRYIDYDTADIVDTLGQPHTIITPVARFSDFDYIKLSDIQNMSGDSILVFHATVPNASFYQHISGQTNSGFHEQQMVRSDSTHYIDTLSLPQPNQRLWNIILMREFRRYRIPATEPPADTMLIDNFNWCVPYRVPQ